MPESAQTLLCYGLPLAREGHGKKRICFSGPEDISSSLTHLAEAMPEALQKSLGNLYLQGALVDPAKDPMNIGREFFGLLSSQIFKYTKIALF